MMGVWPRSWCGVFGLCIVRGTGGLEGLGRGWLVVRGLWVVCVSVLWWRGLCGLAVCLLVASCDPGCQCGLVGRSPWLSCLRGWWGLACRHRVMMHRARRGGGNQGRCGIWGGVLQGRRCLGICVIRLQRSSFSFSLDLYPSLLCRLVLRRGDGLRQLSVISRGCWLGM